MMLKQKVALITGAGWTGGIGKQIAMTFSDNGAVVIANDIDASSAQETARQLTERGARAEAAAGDVTDLSQMQELVAGVVHKYGRIDILVNNAGIRSSGLLEDLTVEHIDAVISVNLKGVILCTKAVIPAMKTQRYGRIISITSIAAKMGGGEFRTSTSIYSAAKAGIGGFTRSLARELGPYAITVNAVSPGLVDLGARSRTRPPEMIAAIQSRIPLGRLGKSTDIADAIAFLASDRAGYITGQDIDVNGGWYMGA